MKLSVGYSKNEALELIIAELIMFLAGYLFGLPNLGSFFNLHFENPQVISFSLFVVATVFIKRALNASTRHLNSVIDSVNDAQSKLNITMIESDQTRRALEAATKSMKEQEEELKEIKDNTFSLMSKTGFYSLEDLMKKSNKELERKINEVRDFLNRKFGHTFW